MKVLIKKSAGSDYNRDEHNVTLKKLRGLWVDVDTAYLFNDQYNLKDYGLRVYDSDIDAVQDDARRGLVKCGYCGKQFHSMEELTRHYEAEEASAHNCASCPDFIRRCVDIKHDHKEETDRDGNRIVTDITRFIYGSRCRWETGCNKLEHRNHKPFVFTPENTYFLKYPNGYRAYFEALPDLEKWDEMGMEWNQDMKAALIRRADTGTYLAYLSWTPDGWELLLKNSRRSVIIPADIIAYCLSNCYNVAYCMVYDDSGKEKRDFAKKWDTLPASFKRATGAAIEYVRDQMRSDYKRDFIREMEAKA